MAGSVRSNAGTRYYAGVLASYYITYRHYRGTTTVLPNVVTHALGENLLDYSEIYFCFSTTRI